MLLIVLAVLLAAAALLIAALATGATALGWASAGLSAVAAVLLVWRAVRERKARAAEKGRHRVHTSGPATSAADIIQRETPPVLAEDDYADDYFDADHSDAGLDDDVDEHDDVAEEPAELPEPAPAEPVATRFDPADDEPSAPPADGQGPAEEPEHEPLVSIEPVPAPLEAELLEPEAEIAPPSPVVPLPIPDPEEEDTDASDVLVVSDLPDDVYVVDEYPRYHLAECEWLIARESEPIPVSEAREIGFTPCAYCGPDAILAERHRAASRR